GKVPCSAYPRYPAKARKTWSGNYKIGSMSKRSASKKPKTSLPACPSTVTRASTQRAVRLPPTDTCCTSIVQIADLPRRTPLVQPKWLLHEVPRHSQPAGRTAIQTSCRQGGFFTCHQRRSRA